MVLDNGAVRYAATPLDGDRAQGIHLGHPRTTATATSLPTGRGVAGRPSVADATLEVLLAGRIRGQRRYHAHVRIAACPGVSSRSTMPCAPPRPSPATSSAGQAAAGGAVGLHRLRPRRLPRRTPSWPVSTPVGGGRGSSLLVYWVPNQRRRRVRVNCSFSAASSCDGPRNGAVGVGPERKSASTLPTRPSPNSM
jgi:hypothetical protein